MKLLRETLTNFMGIRSFTFEPNGNNANVFADNGAGKSTLFSAFTFLLFDKDSTGKEAEGKSGFRLKTLDADGKAIPMIDHSVELVFEHNGKQFTLKKTFAEVWTKKRGTATATFTGHETTYEIDGVPKQKKDFDAFLSRLCDESLLRMLTDPDYFPGKMEWKDRRRILIDMCGDVSTADVIASNSKLSGLADALAGRDVEDHRKVLAAQKTRLNDEIKMIPVRIDEATRVLPDTGSDKPETLNYDLQKAKSDLSAVEKEILTLAQGGAATEKRLKIRQIEAEILAKKNQVSAAASAAASSRTAHINELSIKRDTAIRAVSNANASIKQLTDSITAIDKQLEQKRTEWVTEDAKEFDADSAVAGACPTCGQALPEEQVQAAREKAVADFNLKKSERLSEITATGIALKEKKQAAQNEIAKLTDSIKPNEFEAESLAAQIKALQTAAPVAEEPAEIGELRQQVATIESEIKQLEADTEPEKERLTAKQAELKNTVAALESSIAKFAQREQGETRIAELKAREKTLAAEYGDLERQTYLTEEFIRSKVQLLESKINSKFQTARFQMFAEQVNGGLAEVCEVLGPNGVHYSKGLNHAAKINTGLDIVNTLSRHYGFTAPCFIDNAEAVTQILPTDSQQIRLVVSAADKTLRVEVE